VLCVFSVENYSVQRIFIKKCFLLMVRSGCCLKRFTIGYSDVLKDVRKSHVMPYQKSKWLRQQSRDFYAAGS
jgi:hypothetical protein